MKPPIDKEVGKRGSQLLPAASPKNAEPNFPSIDACQYQVIDLFLALGAKSASPAALQTVVL
jgi:hypothetical protein